MAAVYAAIKEARNYVCCSAGRDLPRGWSQDVTPEGRVYFIDHNTRTTTFEGMRAIVLHGFFFFENVHLNWQCRYWVVTNIRDSSYQHTYSFMQTRD